MPPLNSNTAHRKAIFGNLGVAMVTPFTATGEVDHDQAVALATKLVDDGCDSLVISGTTGETSTLTDEESVGMFRTVVEAVGDRARIIAGSTTNDTAHSIQLSQAAAKVGVHGLLVTAPYYNMPSQTGVQAHIEAVASCTDLPVMIYDIPGRAGISISTETLIRLAEHPNVVALKDAKADYQATTRVLASTDLEVYSGDDGLTLPLMAAGAQGLISVAANVATVTYRRLIDALLEGDLATARALHFELDPVQRAVMSHLQGAVAAKTVLKWQGVLSNAIVRLPLVEPTEEEAAPIRADLAEAGIEL